MNTSEYYEYRLSHNGNRICNGYQSSRPFTPAPSYAKIPLGLSPKLGRNAPMTTPTNGERETIEAAIAEMGRRDTGG